MRLPRDLGGEELAALLKRYVCEVTRQTSSQMRLTTTQEGEHQVTIPRHGSLWIGTLSAILSDVAEHFGMPREALQETLFGK